MNTPLKKALDAAAISAFALVCFSGLVLRTALPVTARAAGITIDGSAPTLFGASHGTWASLNNAATILLLFLLLANLYWGWGALARLFRKGDGNGSGTRAALGVVAALTLVGGFFTGFKVSGPSAIITPAGDNVPLMGDDSDGMLSELSLEEAERRMGIPREFLRSNLGLPANVSITEPFSSLMARHNFTLDDVRRVVLIHRADQSLRIPDSPNPPEPLN